MKSLIYPIILLSAMLVVAILFYFDLMDDYQLKVGLFVCSLLWFAGLAVMDFVKKKSAP
jgi:hypothetical protein